MKLLAQEKDKHCKDKCGHMVDQDAMKGPTPIDDSRNPSSNPSSVDRESKFARVKRMLTCQQRTATTYDEARASCKARKRKERQESVSSIVQERKVIRSNSEERPIHQTPNAKDIRRVSSHEDFQKHPPHQTQQQPDKNDLLSVEADLKKISPCRDVSIDVFILDDGEYERRRSHERFSKPMTQRPKYSTHTRRPKVKHFQKPKDKLEPHKENIRKVSPKRPVESENKPEEKSCNFLQLRPEEKERSPSPVHSPISPPLDISTLHEQIDCEEPIPSSSSRLINENTETLPSLSVASNRLLSSPRNSVIITQRIYLSSDVPQNNSSLDDRNPKEEKLKQLGKQINSIKKKLKKYDEEFEAKYGYRPSHADKLNEKSMKKLCADLSKLKKEQKQLKLNDEYFIEDDGKDRYKREAASLQETLMDIENRLNGKRLAAERSETIEQMTNAQLIEEKIVVQKALLYLESMHGRPSSKEDRDLVRPIYDRYRQLKRMVRLTTPCNNMNELATILEHETMDFVSLPTQTSEAEAEAEADKQNLTGPSTDSDTDTSVGENLHSLGYEELVNEHRLTVEEKKNLRRSLKQFEDEFQTKTGRKLQKEDRSPMENVYSQYKKAKAKLRLLDALLGKQAL